MKQRYGIQYAVGLHEAFDDTLLLRKAFTEVRQQPTSHCPACQPFGLNKHARSPSVVTYRTACISRAMSSVGAKLFNSGHALGPLDPAAARSMRDNSVAIETIVDATQAVTPSKAPSVDAGHLGTGGGNNSKISTSRADNSDYPPYPYPSFNLADKEPRSLAARPIGPDVNGHELQTHRRADTASTAGRSKYGGVQSGMQIFGTPQVGVIGQHKPRDVVRLDRDYSEGEICQFWSGYPFELEGRVRVTGSRRRRSIDLLSQINAIQHMTAMNQLNEILASAFDPYKSIFDNLLAVLSLYLSTWLVSSHYDRVRSVLRYSQHS